jgi:prepilin-type processing-associated H-X9-DG protein
MKRFTKPDVVALVLCVLFLACSLGPVGSAGRERAKRAVCLANLGQLTRAWLNYAVDHNGKIVNGDAGFGRAKGELSEAPWVERCWPGDYMSGGQLPPEIQAEQISRGALWPYVEEVRLYRCPSGYPGEMLTYSAVDAANGRHRSGTYVSRGHYIDDVGERVGDTVLWLKRLDEIITPGPAERMVFIDEGWVAPDSFAVHYLVGTWWDDPPLRHAGGTNVSFADAHAEHWQWRGQDTVELGKGRAYGHPGAHMAPETWAGVEDLCRVQRGVWGRLGYGW